MAESRGKIAHDFRVFFMGHSGSMEARYTTNKGILPETLIREMQNAYKRSEEFLDLDLVVVTENKPETKPNDPMENVMPKATPEDLGKMQDMLQSWAKEILSRK